MYKWIITSFAAVALIGTGLVHGYWTDRWNTSEDTAEAALRLHDIPMNIGDWEGRDLETRPGQAGPGVTGCVQRSYFNRHLGVTVIIALVNGRPGPVATHTPEVCYGANGYMVDDRQDIEMDTGKGPAHFWTSRAVRTKVTEESRIRLYWAWNAGEGWTASKDARNQFPRYRYPVLHKLYVLRDVGNSPDPRSEVKGNGAPEIEPCELFLKVLLPELDRVLFKKGT